jgi:Isocitrate/isopropylmalate dehydrogenase
VAPQFVQPGSPLPQETVDACLSAAAVLKGPVGDPEFDAADVRPEQGLLGLRTALDVYANIRPALLDDVDLLTVRELVGGLYFGAKGVRDDGTVFDTCEYHPRQVERIARRAFRLAESRRGLLTSVDKATCSRPRACGGASSTSWHRSFLRFASSTCSSTTRPCSSRRILSGST